MDNNKTNLWLQNTILLSLVALLVCAYVLLPDGKAHAAGGGWETDGILCVSASGEERILLIDTTKKTMCVYRTRGLGEFRLVGARSFQYDVEKDGVTVLDVKRIYEQKMNMK